jgi:5-methylcytosine-specific restriction protein A
MKEPLIFERHRQLPPPGRAASGRPTCRACQKEIVSKRRTSFCSPECGEDASIRSSSSYARFKVEERDHGICSVCGMDTEYVKSILNPYLKEAANQLRDGQPEFAQNLRIIVYQALFDLGFSSCIASAAAGHAWSGVIATHLWESDHVVPVVHGGGGCGLNNLRTLCRACHHHATAVLAGSRAKTKRLVKKRDRHAERMAMKAAGTQLPLSRKWRR